MIKSDNVVFESCHGRSTVYDLRFTEDSKEKPLLIFCHGFKGFKDWGHFNLIADSFAEAGLIVLKFNFTYNGGTIAEVIDFPDLEAFSENNYLKEVEDIHHLIQLIEKREIAIPNWNGEIFLLGHSRGGGMVTIAGSENEKVTKVVSWAGISDCIKRLPNDSELKKWQDEGVRYIMNGRTNQNMPMKYQFVESLLSNRDRLNIKSATQKMNKPHLVLHGTNDDAVSVQNAKDIHAWNPNSKLILIEEANHVFWGKHPWDENELPKHSQKAVQATIEFLLGS